MSSPSLFYARMKKVPENARRDINKITTKTISFSFKI
jgi:hypothetical protein